MIYNFISTILFLVFLPFWYLISCINPKLGYGFKEKLGFAHKGKLGRKTIVFYGVSVGEVLALKNLIIKTKEKFPDFGVVIATGTKTGQETAKKNFADIADYITYFPFDFYFCIKPFIKKVNPEVIVIAETELWPNFASYVKCANIPLYIVNGRMSDRTYNSYKKLSFFFKGILKNYTKILTQSKSDNEKLISIGSTPEKTVVMGNLKFDIQAVANDITIEKNPNDKIIIAGSTHATEDEIVLSAFKKVRNESVKLLIAPRHPERNEKVYELCKETGLRVGRRSNGDNFTQNDIILLDTLGELGKLYSVCDFAFIGGSFNKTGGHNPLEAVIFNKPVITGPSVHNFKDIYAIITRTLAGTIVADEIELSTQMHKLLDDKEYYNNAVKDCALVFKQNQGATEFVIDELNSVLKQY